MKENAATGFAALRGYKKPKDKFLGHKGRGTVEKNWRKKYLNWGTEIGSKTWIKAAEEKH